VTGIGWDVRQAWLAYLGLGGRHDASSSTPTCRDSRRGALTSRTRSQRRSTSVARGHSCPTSADPTRPLLAPRQLDPIIKNLLADAVVGQDDCGDLR